ncbi:MAG: indolepyruvate ferredoxin oxidoreductase family protein [Geminicoccaceae bacterium]|nr:indolepyruvate ferredoxin oxidoreductase family protein [Geminicoccaceae bacterium]MDW8341269.1 indolepyruvate ferredoxin oxidoreductase family protein [Geminicoccaceae bacterium]
MTQLLSVSLDDKYRLEEGRVYLTGVQALVRLPIDQIRRDRRAGLKTAGYVTGYRGSPLGGYDQQLAAAKAWLAAHDVVHQPAVNEDLAATACQGTQQVNLTGEGRFEGVFAIWYGKGPGVDRSGDAIRHGNLFGTDPKGGVLLLLGDDHICESSTTAHQSEYAMVDAMVPVLNPSGVQEILEYGLYGIALSRFSGAWAALKCIHDTVESTASIAVSPDRPRIVLPEEALLPPVRRHIEIPPEVPWPPMALEVERRLHTVRMQAAKLFARVNRLDRVVLGAPGARVVVATTGKSYQDVVVALDELGIDEARARALGLAVFKVAMTFPLEPEALLEATRGSELLLVVEEKRGLVESQAKEILYNRRERPIVIGKEDEEGRTLFPSWGQLEPLSIAIEIGRRLFARTGDPALAARLRELEERRAHLPRGTAELVRLPWFCPGCPHNTSTKVPEGSRAVGGIGCHFMVTWMGRDTLGWTQMGGEGASWIGQAPFSTRAHVFQNIGDGTFYHSGSLAVRAAVASGANVTFKILFNDAVAMTGGQKMETANLGVAQITRLLEAEGVQAIAVVTDEPEKYPIPSGFAPGVTVHHRDELDAVQRRMRTIPGVTAIVYDQTCAAEKRRRRKRGRYPDPDERVVINELVCEGCGDCGLQSNCVAIQPVETEYGRKRRIDQSACNKDFSCLRGFCPSFVSVRGAKLKKTTTGIRDLPFPVLPEPELPVLDRPYGIVVAGIGGTGVVTIAALLGMAAHLEGKGFVALDMIGLAQKGGAVVSHLKIAPSPEAVGAPRVAPGGARLLLGCDLLVAAGRTALPTVRRGVTRIVANSEEVLTGAFTRDPDLAFPGAQLRRTLEEAAGAERVEFVEATRLATALLGDAIAANLFLVGYAWQRGLVPLSEAAILRAIEINGVAVAFNQRAFAWGRRAAFDLEAVRKIAGIAAERRPLDLEATIADRVRFLTEYQDGRWAERYRKTVERVRAAEERVAPGSTALSLAVARNLFKLMAYKDEYEVARLMSGEAFRAQLAREFESWDRLEFHLAPPLLAERDPRTGHLRKKRFGPWMMTAFRWLAHLRRLRGTPFDPFGWTRERRTERALIAEYEALLDEILLGLSADRLELAIELARLPEGIRGFGHVKEANLARVRARWRELAARWRTREAVPLAAE